MIALSTFLATSATAAAATAGTTAAATAGAAGVAAATATSALSFSSMLSAGFTVASGLAALASGKAQSDSLKGAAQWEDFNASQELLKGRAESLDAVRQGNEAIAQAQVAGFAAGLQGTGSVTTAKAEAEDDAEFASSWARNEGRIAAGARRGKAVELRSDAKASRWSSRLTAFGKFADGADRFGRTG